MEPYGLGSSSVQPLRNFQQRELPWSTFGGGQPGIPRAPARGSVPPGFSSNSNVGISSLPVGSGRGGRRGRGGQQYAVKRPRTEEFRSMTSSNQFGQPVNQRPVVHRKYPMEIYFFRSAEGNQIPSQRVGEYQMELDFMRKAGLIRQVEFDVLEGRHIYTKISEAFGDCLGNQEWTLLSRLDEPGKLKSPFIWPTDLDVLSPSWADQDLYTERALNQARRRMYIALAHGTLNIPREIFEEFAADQGRTVEELDLRNVPTGITNSRSPFGLRETSRASTSALGSASRASTSALGSAGRASTFGFGSASSASSGFGSASSASSGFGSAFVASTYGFGSVSASRNSFRGRLDDTSPSPPSSPDLPRRRRGRLMFNDSASGRQLSNNVIVLGDSDNSEAEEEKKNAVAASSAAVTEQIIEVAEFPEVDPGASEISIESMRSRLCLKVTGQRPMVKSDIVFVWIKRSSNVQNFIDFYYARADGLAYGGRMEVEMDDASDWDGPFKECITELLEGFRSYKIPDVDIDLFEVTDGITLITGKAITTEGGISALRAFGFLLREAILHGSPFPQWFNNSAFRYVLNLPVEVNDIFRFNVGTGDTIKDILSGTGPIVWANETSLQTWAENHPAFPTVALVQQGRQKLCRHIAEYELCGKRASNLKYLSEGLLAGTMGKELREIRAQWKFFEKSLYREFEEVDDLLEEFLPYNEHAEDISDELMAEQLQIVNWFDEIVKHDLSHHERRQLLRFVTSGYRIPATPKIAIVFSVGREEERRPQASTCSHKLMLPVGCESKDKLRLHLRECILSVDSEMAGFFQIK
ncbi:uncharacterized protein LOC129582085 isoform X2 [Paramacrobiotus metropolitanus]|uniref:uncharacterized protein LOC129582085 isoform X2 n=1 Tax=Paramacrobiotus metropolitanus TaxID=2943436 RepID=UPI00244646E2|nr:uncharacterized protein LOC129582085 isoform X2 [Paramacrobiotus metropolitanus]